MLDKILNTTCRKSGHSSAFLNVNLTYQFLECSYWKEHTNIVSHTVFTESLHRVHIVDTVNTLGGIPLS